MYRFMWAPKWILSHLFVLALVATMVVMGMWQLRRLDDKQVRNEQIEERSAGAPVLFSGAVAVDATGDAIDDLDYTNMSVTGTYDTAAEFVVINRSLDGVAGRWILTPLEPSDGGPTVLVLRGFVSQAMQDVTAPIEGFEPADGEVTVEGWARPGREAEGFQTEDSHLESGEWTRVDIAQYSEETGTDVAPMYLQLYAEAPPAAESGLLRVPLPELDEGPHLGYAGQWAIFTLIAIVGYPLILRKVARERRVPEPRTEPGASPASPDTAKRPESVDV